MSTSLSTRHPLTITYTVMVSDEVIANIKESDGTRYWVYGDDFAVDTVKGNTVITSDEGVRYTYDTETCLKGIALWLQNGGDWSELNEMDTDHMEHDSIWQYGFFGELVYG